MSQENTFRENIKSNSIDLGFGTKEYQNHTSKGGDSSVFAYRLLINRIMVHFVNRQNKSSIYTYKRKVVGGNVYFDMKDLARQGHGLNSFIMRNKIPWSEKE